MSPREVLVADDEPDIRLLVRARLLRDGWQVHLADDGDQALDVWRSHDITAAVLDQQMPGMTGLETFRALRDRGFHGPAVLFSAYLDPDLERSAEDAGMTTLPKGDVALLSGLLAGLVEDEG